MIDRMLMLIRHLIAIAALPFTVAVLIPWWIGRRYQTTLTAGHSAPEILSQLLGIIFLATGLLLFTASLWYFAVRGRGTLAPWDPPKILVIEGPYRYVRHPMISGVLFILFGEALLLLSPPHARWALLALCINALYLPLLEEPLLELRFGDAYREYKRHVWGFVPHLRPWKGETSSR